MQCGVCSSAISKYKCPTCVIPYCSLPCFKIHKAIPCTKKEPQVIEEISSVQPARDFDDESQLEKRLSKSQLQAVATSEEIRTMLRNEELQEMIRKIDASSTAEHDLDTAMNLPEFKDLTDKLLSVIGANK